MRFLLTNDDGIDAPGLAALEAAIRPLGEVCVAAPDEHLSGCSHRVSDRTPLRATGAGEGRYAVSGTPADCVRLGLLHLASEVDWVLSGVNDGGNLGVDVYMSGTVAAAREAAFLGKRAIAFSHYRRRGTTINWALMPELVRRVFVHLATLELPRFGLWNVNFPDDADLAQPPHLTFCPLDHNPMPIEYALEEGHYHYRGRYQERQREAGSDIDVCFRGGIAVTQLVPTAWGIPPEPRTLLPD